MPHDPTSADLIGFALEKQPEEFKQTFYAIMGQKAVEAVAAKKAEVANSYMGDEVEAEEISAEDSSTEEQETEEEQDGQNS